MCGIALIKMGKITDRNKNGEKTMDGKFTKRICAGFVAAAFMLADVVCASGADLRRFKSYKDSDIVNVIVTIKGEPVLSCEKAEKDGTEYLSTAEADKKESALLSAQSKAKSSIESFYPELEVKYSYTSLVNGFVCSLPEELISEVKNCPYVENVQISHSFSKPQLKEGLSAIGADVFCNETGCTGAGESIAILDTELDTDHDMFAPISEDKAQFSKSDIENFIKSNNLNAELDVDKAYINSKVPLAYSYTNYDDPYDISDDSYEYHGTHVSGIAAGNKVTDDKGREISGVAPDAQIIFMNVCTHNEYNDEDDIYDYDVIAAMEDCVKLGVTAMNLSFGNDRESSEDTVYTTACDNAEKAGITVCSAAGNESSYDYSPENPDTSTLNSPSDFASVMSVASADNSVMECYVIRLKDDSHPILYTEAPSDNDVYFMEHFDGQDVSYVDYENADENDLSGKIALCFQNGRNIGDVINDAGNAGASGAIIVYDENTLPDDYSCGNIPAIIIRQPDGETLKNAENKVLSVKSDETDLFPVNVQMSSYSSMGVSESLELKPDITAVGGNVYSAARGNKYDYNSGTSMASPFVAGCAALVSEKMKKDSVNLTGADKTLYIKNMLMNSAVPLTDDESGKLYSPRLQGAGMVNMENLLNDNLLVTSSDGRAKVCLYDEMKDSFSIPLELKNLSDEDISFSDVQLKLFTDDSVKYEWYTDEIIRGTQDISFNADLSELKTVSAGQTKKVSLKVDMDSAQLKEIGEKFTNGFFVEGYIMLSDSENCCDISVPVMGYYGNWDEVPIFSNDTSGNVDNYFSSSINGLDFPLGYSWADDENKSEDFYISPNGDHIFDDLLIQLTPRRDCINAGVEIYDKDGNLMLSTKQLLTETDLKKGELNDSVGFYDISDLKDGEEYTAKVYGKINYPDSKEQSFTFNFKTDCVSPEIVSSSVINENGRKIVKLEVKDNGKLEGIEVVGKGKGCIYGDKTINNEINAFDNFINTMKQSDFYYEGFDTQLKHVDFSEINFAQRISAQPDENGIFTLEYDVTDMESYDFIVADAALNLTEYTENGVVAPDDDGKENPDGNNSTEKPDNPEKTPNNSDKTPDNPDKKPDNKSSVNPSTGSENGFAVCAVILGGVILSSRRKKRKSR